MSRFCRVRVNGDPRYARIDGAWLTLLERAPWDLRCRDTVTKVPLDGAELLVPSEAAKVVAIGQNYRKHAEEMGKPVPAEPLIFMKPATALNPTGRPIVLPAASQEVHHEAELAVVIGKQLKRASEEEAAAGIFGATCFNDVTARDIQRREIQHTRAKSYDTFACCGPWIETDALLSDLAVRCRVNGELRQDGRTSDMVFSPARLVSFISSIMTLLPGDIVSTGTPSGVGRLSAGDRVEVELEGIGTLVNPVEKEAT
jgi:2-keto-4-pentenoate hydratase/2-oxohepta-3-ene-1,7-dioic acid hydratase in catechol pathway